MRSHVRRTFAICLVLAAVLACLSGCRVSDALTEVIYDQSADIIDYDNPTKIYINDSTADVESEDFAAKEVNEDANVVSDTIQNLVVYSSAPNTEGFTAKKSVFAHPSDFEGIEASEEVCFVQSDDPDAFDHAVTVQEPPPPDDEEEPEEEEGSALAQGEQANSEGTSSVTTSTSSNSSASSNANGNTGNSGDSFEPIGDNPTDNGGDGGATNTNDNNGTNAQPNDTNQGGGNDNGGVKTPKDMTNPANDPPKVSKIAAFGPAATIVQMIGGKGALAASDAETLSSGFKDVFDTSGIKIGWTGDGADASQLDVDAIVASGAETILVYTGTYFDSLSQSDRDRLTEGLLANRNKGLSDGSGQDDSELATLIYTMGNSGDIKRDVEIVGKMLADAKDIQYAGDTVKRATDYQSFHDEVVSAAAAANGGLAGGGTIFQAGSDDAAPSFSRGDYPCTLVVDAYDEGASYTGPSDEDWQVADGLAFASAGYSTTPLSYYLQAGGLVNTVAEDQGGGATGKIPVIQFQKNSPVAKVKNWSSKYSSEVRSANGNSLLTTARNPDIIGMGSSFGTSWFPRLIVASNDAGVSSSAIKESIIANSNLANGAYHQYERSGMFTGEAIQTPSGIAACIGYGGSDSSLDHLLSTEEEYRKAIVVNPTGLFSDWTEGTVESFLEAAWANDVVRANEDPGNNLVGWVSKVNEFYTDFYDYPLGEDTTSGNWQKILGGAS